MNEIYNHRKIKAMISLTKGEGFGRPLLEFSLSKKPIIVSGWSGHMDFLNPEYNIVIGGNLTKSHESVKNQFLLPDAEWFSPDHGSIGGAFQSVFKDYKKYQQLGKRQGYHSKENFSWDKMKNLLSSLLEKNIPEFPKEISLELSLILMNQIFQN